MKVELTKEIFCDYLRAAQKNWDWVEKLGDLFDCCIWENAPIDYSTHIVKMLNELMELPETDAYGTDIDYFVYELDFGRKWELGMVKDFEDEDIPMSTPEELWDYLERCVNEEAGL